LVWVFGVRKKAEIQKNSTLAMGSRQMMDIVHFGRFVNMVWIATVYSSIFAVSKNPLEQISNSSFSTFSLAQCVSKKNRTLLI
jgi:hypothetical protein